MTGTMIIEIAKRLYEQDPSIDSDGEETWTVAWEDIEDSYPATYEYFIDKAYRILRKSCK